MPEVAPARARGRSRARPTVEKPFALRDLPLDGEGALYGQIYRALRKAILEGRVAAGTRLPTSRALAMELGISRNTVVAAFEPLRAEGYVHSRVGAGTFVAAQVETRPGPDPDSPRWTARNETEGGHALEGASGAEIGTSLRLSRFGRSLRDDRPRRLHDADRDRPTLPFDFRPCVPDLERLPDDRWRRALVRTANYLPSSEFDYGEPRGVRALREAIAAYLGRARGIGCEPDHVIIVGGVAQALDLSARVFLDAEDSVLVEDPHYLGARRVFRAAGARLVAAPVDAEGIDLSALAAEDREAAKLAYVTPSHQFPTGVVMSLSRRLELLDWARQANAFVIEDDYDSEFRYAGRAIEALKSLDRDERVLYVGTFSKTLLPSMRIAYLVAPPALVEIYRNAKWISDWAAPTFEQHALAGYVESGEFERHLRRARTLYSESRDALIASMRDELEEFDCEYFDGRTGLHLLVRFPTLSAEHEDGLVAKARAVGLGLYPASPCYLHPAERPLELVMGFARLESDAIRAGIAKLRALLGEIDGRSV